MAYIIPAGYSRVSLKYAARSPLGSQIVAGFGVDKPPSEIVLDAINLWWDESLKLRTSSSYRLESIEARNDVEVLERTVGEFGTFPSEVVPPNTAALVSLSSGLVGRSNRGRIYMPGVVGEAEVSATGTIEASALTSLQGVINYLGAALGDVSASLVILHSATSDPTLVTSAQVQSVVATQRRRLRA